MTSIGTLDGALLSPLKKPTVQDEGVGALVGSLSRELARAHEKVVQDRLNRRLSKQVSIRKLNGYFRAISDRLN